MGLCDKWKRKTIDWDGAYQTEPKFYEKQDCILVKRLSLDELEKIRGAI